MRKRDTQKKYSAQYKQLKSANESTLQLRAGAHRISLKDTETSLQSLAPDSVARNQRIGGFIRLKIAQLCVDWQSPKPVHRDF